MPKLIRRLLLVLLSILGLGGGPESSVSSEMVACFNDSDDDGDYGMWIYDGYSDWRAARQNPKGMLVFGLEPRWRSAARSSRRRHGMELVG